MKRRLIVISIVLISIMGVVSAQISQDSLVSSKSIDIFGLNVKGFNEFRDLIKKWNQPIIIYQKKF